jgi:OOP family OmpA-OmpF porin
VPVIESALDESIARNRSRLANALYPILGAMIRRNIAEGVRDAIASINTILERALSPEGFRWRWQSLRTGVPVSQIAFKHSIVFRTEHVFLIQNRTTQLLWHLSTPEAMDTEKFVFAGMIGAITDFIKDAFFRKEPIGLRSIDVGQFTVWFEEGPEATLAVVIRGEPQPILRFRLKTICEKLHAQYHVELRDALTDEVSVMGYDSLLRESLLQQPRIPIEKPKKTGRIAAVAVALLLLILAAAGLSSVLRVHSRDARFERFVSSIKSSEGVLITDHGKQKDGKYFVAGMAAGASSAIPPVERFGLRSDEVEVKLIPVSVGEKPNTDQLLSNYFDQLTRLDGAPWPTTGPSQAWIKDTAARVADAYLLGRTLGRSFIVVIEYPDRLKSKADRFSGQISWQLYLRGVYERHLLRTLSVRDGPAILKVLPERTVGE